MKKVLVFFGLVLSVLGLASCGSQTITYVDANGVEHEVKVTETDDIEVVQAVLDFSNVNNYENITQLGANLNAGLNLKLSNAGSSYEISMTAAAEVAIHQEKGFMGSVVLDFLSKENAEQNKQLISGSALYNGDLVGISTSKDLVYVKYTNNTSPMQKMSVPAYMVMEEIENAFKDEIPSLPQMPDIDMPEVSTLEDFYKAFPTSKVRISDVSSENITVHFAITIEDLMGLVLEKEELAQLKTLLKFDFSQTIDFEYDVDPQTGLFLGFHFHYNSLDVINFLLQVFATADVKVVVEKFDINFDLALTYNNVTIPTLTDAEKKDYEPVA